MAETQAALAAQLAEHLSASHPLTRSYAETLLYSLERCGLSLASSPTATTGEADLIDRVGIIVASHRPFDGKSYNDAAREIISMVRASSPTAADLDKPCTCHPDDRPAVCQRRYALTDCLAALDKDAEIARVEAAYREGWFDRDKAGDVAPDDFWEASDARAALAQGKD